MAETEDEETDDEQEESEDEQESEDEEHGQEAVAKVVTPSKKKRKMSVAAARRKAATEKKKAARKKKTDKINPGDKVLEVDEPEYPLKMGPTLQQTTMTQLYDGEEGDDDETVKGGNQGTSPNKTPNHWQQKKDALSNRIFLEHDVNHDIQLPHSQPSSQSIASVEAEEAATDTEALQVAVAASMDEETDIENIGTVIPDDAATKNKTDSSIESDGTSNGAAKYTQEQEFTQDFKHNELKELQWSPAQREFLKKFGFSEKDFGEEATTMLERLTQKEKDNDEASENLLMEDSQATTW